MSPALPSAVPSSCHHTAAQAGAGSRARESFGTGVAERQAHCVREGQGRAETAADTAAPMSRPGVGWASEHCLPGSPDQQSCRCSDKSSGARTAGSPAGSFCTTSQAQLARSSSSHERNDTNSGQPSVPCPSEWRGVWRGALHVMTPAQCQSCPRWQ